MNLRLSSILVASYCLFAVVGCTKYVPEPFTLDGHPVDRVEIHFRDFDVLSYLPYSERELVRNSEIELSLTNPAEIKLLEQLPKTCAADVSADGDAMNLYALIQFYDQGKQIGRWRYSKFHYSKKSGEALCKMDQAQRDQVRATIAILKKRQVR